MIVVDYISGQLSIVELSLNAALPGILIGLDVPDGNIISGSLSGGEGLDRRIGLENVSDDPLQRWNSNLKINDRMWCLLEAPPAPPQSQIWPLVSL